MDKSLVKKYVLLYMKTNLRLGLLCSAICFIPLYIVALIYDVEPHDIAISFVPFLIALGCILLSYLLSFRFRRIITEQENRYRISFTDTNARYFGGYIYLTDDWLINAGITAFYKRHIELISSKVEHGKVGSSNRVTITTVDKKKYVIWVLSASDVKKIKSWIKE